MPAINRRQFLAGSAALLAAGCGGRKTASLERPLPERPNFVVVLADTLRADHLSCYGYRRPTTPNLDAVAEQSILFEQCFSNAAWTLPATASLLTGAHPLVHRTAVPEWSEEGRARGFQFQVLPESLPTTASALREHGYTTGWFQANPNASADRGLGRGFHHFFFDMNTDPDTHMDAVLEWLENEAEEPFYAYIHLIDPHEPYSADPKIFARLHGERLEEALERLPEKEREQLRDYHKRSWSDLFIDKDRLDTSDLRAFSGPAVQYFKGLYDSEIRQVDQAFGRLQEWMHNRGLHRRTITMVTSDHGEAFGEDNLFYHGSSLHDPQIHVPFFVALPGLQGGTRVPWTVSLSDLHPTILGLAGVSDPASGAARGLLRRNGALVYDGHRPVLSSLDLHQSDTAQWQFRLTRGAYQVTGTGDQNLVRVEERGSGRNSELVRPTAAGALGEAARQAVESFYGERQRLSKAARGVAAPEWRQAKEFDPKVFEALGYL